MKRENNTISICVRSLSTYAEADWVTPTEALDFMDKQNKIDGSEEFIIVDYDAPFAISEYDSVSELVEIAEQLENLTDEEIEILATILDGHTSDFEEALRIVEDGDYMVYWDCPNMSAVAEQYCDECGLLNSMPENLRYYFDFEAYGRDMSAGICHMKEHSLNLSIAAVMCRYSNVDVLMPEHNAQLLLINKKIVH